MTSNQIAFASSVENIRHNKEFEDETNRHNTATEDLTQQQVDLDKLRLEYEDQWKRRDQDLTQQYNDLYAQYQQAGIDAKVQLETAMQDIIRNKNEAENLYHQQLVTLQEQQNVINNNKYVEEVQHNKVTEYLTNEQIAANRYIAEQKLKFEKYAQNVESQIQLLNTNIKTLQAQNQHAVDTANATINAERVKADRERNSTNLFLGLWHGAVDLIRGRR